MVLGLTPMASRSQYGCRMVKRSGPCMVPHNTPLDKDYLAGSDGVWQLLSIVFPRIFSRHEAEIQNGGETKLKAGAFISRCCTFLQVNRQKLNIFFGSAIVQGGACAHMRNVQKKKCQNENSFGKGTGDFLKRKDENI